MIKLVLKKYIQYRNYIEKDKNLLPKTREESILMAMGIPYLNYNAVSFVSNVWILYHGKLKKADFAHWDKETYNEFLKELETCSNSFSSSAKIFSFSFTAKSLLKRDWGINSKETALEMLEWLESEGHRKELHNILKWKDKLKTRETESIKEFLKDAYENDIYVSYFFSEFDSFEVEEKELKRSSFYKELSYNLNFIEKFEKDIPNCGILAWDMARYVNLLRMCREAGYINVNECWEMLGKIKDECFENFDSWTDFAKSFGIGRKYWLRNSFDGYDTPESECKNILNDKYSSWNHFKWKN